MKNILIFAGTFMLGAFGCGSDKEEPHTHSCELSVGSICTIAGNGENGYSGDDAQALEARMSLPQDTLHADDGTMYILDWNNHRVRKVTTDGVMKHVAGRGELGGTLDDPANSDLNHPTGMIFNADKTKIVIAAWHNSKIREIDIASNEIIDTCGDGRRAYFGDGTAALTSTLDLPASLAYHPNGDLIVMDQANQVMRRIDQDGLIHHFAGQCIIDGSAPIPGPGPCAEGVEPTSCPAPSGKKTCGVPMETCAPMPCAPAYGGDEGPATAMRMGQPFGQSADPAGRITFDAEGNLYFADTANALIRMIDTDGIVHRVAGVAPVGGKAQTGYSGDGGSALEAKLNNPVDIAIDTDNTIYFTDTYNHCVRAVAPDGTIRTVAGVCGSAGTEGDGGPATEAKLKRPYGVELVDDTLYIADTGNNTIRAVLLR